MRVKGAHKIACAKWKSRFAELLQIPTEGGTHSENALQKSPNTKLDQNQRVEENEEHNYA